MSMLYKALGFAVWNGLKWYLGHRMPSRKAMLAGGGALAAAAAIAASVLAVTSRRSEG